MSVNHWKQWEVHLVLSPPKRTVQSSLELTLSTSAPRNGSIFCTFLSSDRRLLLCGSSSLRHRYCRRHHHHHFVFSLPELDDCSLHPFRVLPSASVSLYRASQQVTRAVSVSLHPSSWFVWWSGYKSSTALAGSRVGSLAGALEIGHTSDVRWPNTRLDPTGCITISAVHCNVSGSSTRVSNLVGRNFVSLRSF